MRDFQIAISQARLEDLHHRLRNTRWPVIADEAAWHDGTSLRFARRLADHWLHRFDWRACEARLNLLPHYLTEIDGIDIHFVHQPGRGPAPLPLVLTHGWPGSFIEMERIIPMLADPASHGGDPADAFHVVVPSLPGFGFSQATRHGDGGVRRVAERWRGLMAKLGYARFAAQGGDIGAAVSTWLARLYPAQLIGVHLNFVPAGFLRPSFDHEPPTPEERGFLERSADWRASDGGYIAIQATRPQSLSYGLTDSPVGLAAWLAEKFRDWSDCGGDVERAFSLDDLLADISLYWFGDVRATLRMYKDNADHQVPFGPSERVAVPLGMACFPRELPMPPRSWVQRVFDVQRWTTMPRGGHFAAMEQPALLAEDIRAFYRPLRQGASHDLV